MTTSTQQATLDYFIRFLRKHKRPPSLREAAEALGLKHQSISQHCQHLVAQGLMERVPPQPVHRGLYSPSRKALKP